jgi:ABC-type nitrate/sulfonate/bicarbonate transport system ATPase subunit
VRAGQVGVVAQNYPLFAHRTVWGNLLLAAKKAKKPESVVAQYLLDFDLVDCREKYPAQLSGGQRQRCAILQQVICGTNLILYDEPFSGLDPIAKRKTETLIQKVANLSDISTAVIVTHDVRSAIAIADHLWLLGMDRAADGSRIPGAYIKESINLIERGLCWHPEIREMKEFAEAVVEIERKFQEL